MKLPEFKTARISICLQGRGDMALKRSLEFIMWRAARGDIDTDSGAAESRSATSAVGLAIGAGGTARTRASATGSVAERSRDAHLACGNHIRAGGIVPYQATA